MLLAFAGIRNYGKVYRGKQKKSSISDTKKMKIEVISYQSEWPRLFEELRRAAVEALAGIDVAVEHVGSTSVPGLAAKPVIDIDIILPQWERFGEVVRRLGTLGFEHRGDLGIPGREAFTRSPRFAFAHNLYVCRPGTPALENHLKLRNYLRSRPDEAARYAALKFKLAERFPDDIDAYCRGKTDLIGEFLLAAGIDSDSVAKIRADNLRDE